MLVDDQGRLSVLHAMLAGSGGGITATITTYPTDMVKTRLTAQHTDPTKKAYKGIFDAFGKIFAQEGILAFYKGMSTSIIGEFRFDTCVTETTMCPVCRRDSIRRGYIHGLRGVGQSLEQTKVTDDPHGELHQRVSGCCLRTGTSP